MAQETQKGRRWDETKIKALTGGDRITARFMRQDFFDFVPTFKLFICGNHKPRLTSVDEAMRRRLLLVPFTVQIPPAERDPRAGRKLKAEWPAILRWCIDGCLEWQRIGLAPPAIVRDATEDYFADQDTLQQWLDDCTEDGGQFAFSRTAELFASWKAWCEDRNMKPGSEQALSEALADRGFAKSPQQHRSTRLPQPRRKTAMPPGLTHTDAVPGYHRYTRAYVYNEKKRHDPSETALAVSQPSWAESPRPIFCWWLRLGIASFFWATTCWLFSDANRRFSGGPGFPAERGFLGRCCLYKAITNCSKLTFNRRLPPAWNSLPNMGPHMHRRLCPRG